MYATAMSRYSKYPEEKNMKKWKIAAITAIMILTCAGCGTQKAQTPAPAESTPVDEAQTNEAPTEEEVAEKNDAYSDLEEKGESGDVNAFAEKIKSAICDATPNIIFKSVDGNLGITGIN